MTDLVRQVWARLRDYQRQGVREVAAEYKTGARSVLYVAPTGSGKTPFAGFIAARQQATGKRSLFLLHRRELIAQTRDLFAAFGIPCGILARGEEFRPGAVVQIASIPLLVARISRGALDLGVWEPTLLIADEAHHAVCTGMQAIFDHWPRAKILGLTATPLRLDRRGLGDVFDRMVLGPGVRDLIGQGYLADYRAFSHPLPDFDRKSLRKSHGDYRVADMEKAVDGAVQIGSAIEHYREHLAGKRCLVFCVSIDHAHHVASQFQAFGYPAAAIDGTMSTTERDGIVADYRAGRTLILTSVAILGEGFDVGETAGVILLRPTASLTLCLQQIGRALRPKADMGEKAIILDAVGNLIEHGLPCAERQWSLDGLPAERKKKAEVAPVKVCRHCDVINPIGARECIECGHPFPVARREVEQVNGKLHEIKPEMLWATRVPLRHAVAQAKTLAELEEIAKARRAAGALQLNYPPIVWARRRWRIKLAWRERDLHRRKLLLAGSQQETEALLDTQDEARWLATELGYDARWLAMVAQRKGWGEAA